MRMIGLNSPYGKGLNISLSSWSRMWQCQTYPGPLVASNSYARRPSCGAKRIRNIVTFKIADRVDKLLIELGRMVDS
jgi:hypothetical protein